jgi:hypothetical protein
MNNKEPEVQTAKELWTELGAGKSDSIKDHVTKASLGKPIVGDKEPLPKK